MGAQEQEDEPENQHHIDDRHGDDEHRRPLPLRRPGRHPEMRQRGEDQDLRRKPRAQQYFDQGAQALDRQDRRTATRGRCGIGWACRVVRPVLDERKRRRLGRWIQHPSTLSDL
jgi:hypothetical protein